MKKIYSITLACILLLATSCSQFGNPKIPNGMTDKPEAVFYNNTVYKGKISEGNQQLVKQNRIDDTAITITEPTTSGFKADGFFTLRGTIKNNGNNHGYCWVRVKKDDYEAFYYPQNSFTQRIWLPFGPGEYTIDIYDLPTVELTNGGNIHSTIRTCGDQTCSLGLYHFKVINTNQEDGKYLYPSYYIQSDNEAIAKKAKELIAGKKTQEEQVRAIHDYVCKTYDYDRQSINSNYYAKQDAITVFETKKCVCEGYVSIMAAMLRSVGFRAKAMAGVGRPNNSRAGNHAWLNVECFKNGVKKYWFVDPTWDDTVHRDGTINTTPSYNYFLLELDDPKIKNSHFPAKKLQSMNINSCTITNMDGYDGKHGGTRPGRSIVD